MLLGIRARVCPECGKAFRVSERRFAPRKAVFCCPGCDAGYVGTGEEGHPEPCEFACAQCGAPLTLDEMIVRRAKGARGRVEIEPIAWHARERLGFFRAWSRTAWSVWSSPIDAARSMPTRAGWLEALWFGLVTWVIASLTGLWGVIGLVLMSFGLMALASGPPPGGVLVFILLMGLFGLCVTVALAWFLLALSGLVMHAALAVTGRTQHGVRGTMEVMGYASAAALLSAPPCLGAYIAPLALVLQGVFAGVMLCVRQRVACWRAVIALAPIGVAIVLIMTWGSVAPAHSLMRMSTRARTGAVTSALGHETLRAMWELERYERTRGGPAAHGADLMRMGYFRPEDFVGAQMRHSGMNPHRVLPAHESQALRTRWEAQALAMPSDVVAHRVGQFVFVHHGVSAAQASLGVWEVITAPDPVSEDILGTMPNPKTGVFDGRVLVVKRGQRWWTEIAAVDVASELVAQNALRAKEGLAPIPDPFTVLEGSPAMAGGSPSP